MRILFDTNVVLDVVLERKPFSVPAGQLFDAADRKMLTGLLTPTTLTTTAYFVEKEKSSRVAFQTVERLTGRFDVAMVGRSVVSDALKTEFDDFEDSVLHEAARQAGAGTIVTRDENDFQAATLTVYTPEELLAVLEAPDE
jgi:predicted nucleic acid-binding protein